MTSKRLVNIVQEGHWERTAEHHCRRWRHIGFTLAANGVRCNEPGCGWRLGTIEPLAARPPEKPFVACSEPDCSRRAIAKGLCKRHYGRAYQRARSAASSDTASIDDPSADHSRPLRPE